MANSEKPNELIDYAMPLIKIASLQTQIYNDAIHGDLAGAREKTLLLIAETRLLYQVFGIMIGEDK
jgi:hypothetical protein